MHVIPTFGALTGAELYLFDLARKQIKDGHKVSVYAAKYIQGRLIRTLEEMGATLLDDLEPGYDIAHAHQSRSAIIASLLDIPVIQTIHSELFPLLEYPVVNKNVVHYICIRPTIQDYATKLVDKEMTSVIYNGVDETLFKEVPYTKSDKPTILFAGPHDYLREKAIESLVRKAKNDESYLILIGRNQHTIAKNVVSFPEVDVTAITQRVDMTASVMLGRTTIEGWLCGKPGIVFTIDNEGNILDQDILPVPKDIEQYTLSYMYKKIMEVYARHLHPDIR